MPRGQKRAAEDEAGPETQAKAARAEISSAANNSASKTSGEMGAEKAPVGASAFRSRALPLHVNVTHTPPGVAEDSTNVAQVDPGFIGSVTLLPSSFSTGGYGWKANRRITIELLNSENGKTEKVQAMLTIDATVIKDSNAKDEDDIETDSSGAMSRDAVATTEKCVMGQDGA